MNKWKKNMIAVAVLVTVCAGIYVNWLYSEDAATADLTDTIDKVNCNHFPVHLPSRKVFPIAVIHTDDSDFVTFLHFLEFYGRASPPCPYSSNTLSE